MSRLSPVFLHAFKIVLFKTEPGTDSCAPMKAALTLESRGGCLKIPAPGSHSVLTPSFRERDLGIGVFRKASQVILIHNPAEELQLHTVLELPGT